MNTLDRQQTIYRRSGLTIEFCVMIIHYCGNSSVVERQLPMLNVVGSSPISRFLNFNLLKF
jgi:hypothetical protein